MNIRKWNTHYLTLFICPVSSFTFFQSQFSNFSLNGDEIKQLLSKLEAPASTRLLLDEAKTLVKKATAYRDFDEMDLGFGGADDQISILGQAGYRQVGLDPTALIQPLRVNNPAGRTFTSLAQTRFRTFIASRPSSRNSTCGPTGSTTHPIPRSISPSRAG